MTCKRRPRAGSDLNMQCNRLLATKKTAKTTTEARNVCAHTHTHTHTPKKRKRNEAAGKGKKEETFPVNDVVVDPPPPHTSFGSKVVRFLQGRTDVLAQVVQQRMKAERANEKRRQKKRRKRMGERRDQRPETRIDRRRWISLFSVSVSRRLVRR